MKILKHLLLELKAKKEGSLYAMRDTTKADDLMLLLNYIFFEYTRTDLEFITQNLEVIDEEQDPDVAKAIADIGDEVILHGNTRSLILDLTNLQTIYICSFSDYQKFETSQQTSTIDGNFVDYLTRKKLEYFIIDRQSFLQILRDWHTILDTRPQFVILYQNKESGVALTTFATRESADKFIATHTK